MDVVLGMDFGGTKIALAVCDLDGRCLSNDKVPTLPDEGADAVLARAVAAGRSLLARWGQGRGSPP